MTAPTAIQPTAVYDLAQACYALGIGETKIRELVSLDELHPLEYTNRLRFFGEDLIALCRAASGGGS